MNRNLRPVRKLVDLLSESLALSSLMGERSSNSTCERESGGEKGGERGRERGGREGE